MPVVHIKRTPLDGWGRIVKRLFDIAGSAGLIALFSPALAATAILIKLDSKGPVFFTRLDDGALQRRIGQDGRAFRYFKFRSMRAKTHGMRYAELMALNARRGPLVKIPDDPRVTRVGKFIRRFSIDELPEFFLVFLGRMSLVGPRPHYPEEVAKYTGYQKRLLTIKPGVTGLAQISGRSDLDFDEEARLDMFYIENWSFWLDMQILLRTPWAVLRGRKEV